jgi:hypothetical protein
MIASKINPTKTGFNISWLLQTLNQIQNSNAASLAHMLLLWPGGGMTLNIMLVNHAGCSDPALLHGLRVLLAEATAAGTPKALQHLPGTAECNHQGHGHPATAGE